MPHRATQFSCPKRLKLAGSDKIMQIKSPEETPAHMGCGFTLSSGATSISLFWRPWAPQLQ